MFYSIEHANHFGRWSDAERLPEMSKCLEIECISFATALYIITKVRLVNNGCGKHWEELGMRPYGAGHYRRDGSYRKCFLSYPIA